MSIELRLETQNAGDIYALTLRGYRGCPTPNCVGQIEIQGHLAWSRAGGKKLSQVHRFEMGRRLTIGASPFFQEDTVAHSDPPKRDRGFCSKCGVFAGLTEEMRNFITDKAQQYLREDAEINGNQPETYTPPQPEPSLMY